MLLSILEHRMITRIRIIKDLTLISYYTLFGLGETGALRAGLAPYSTKDDVDRLVAGIKQYLAKAA